MATISLTTSSGEDARIAAAFGRYLGLYDGSGAPRNATAAEVKAAVAAFVRQVVRDQERASASIPADIAPT